MIVKIPLFQKIALTTAVFFGVLLTAIYVLGELAVYYEMWSAGLTERAELAGSYGVGLLYILVVMPVSFLLACTGGWITWLKMNRLSRKNTTIS